MEVTLPLDKMTVAEKLRLMETLWADVSTNEQQIDSPAWHERVLKEREEGVRSGTETFMDWEVAKEELRKRVCSRFSK